jgi:O-antigen/teichoic acid export membrane protein
MFSKLVVKIKIALNHPGLQRDALFVGAATILSGLGSLVFWKIITLRFPANTVGLVFATIASAGFLGNLSTLGLAAGLIRFLPEQVTNQKFWMIRSSSIFGIFSGFCIGILFLAGRQWWAPTLLPQSSGLIYPASFIVLLIALTQHNINGATIQAEKKFPYLTVQSMMINILQISGGILVATELEEIGILIAYSLPIAITAIILWFFLPNIGHFGREKEGFERIVFGNVLKYSFSTQIFGMIWIVPSLIFPLLVLSQLGAEANAAFSLSWYAYTFLAIFPNAIMLALFVSGSHDISNLTKYLRDALLTNVGIILPSIIIFVLLAPWLLNFFGSFYIRATLLLRLLIISILPMSINGLYATFLRVKKKMALINLYSIFLIGGSALLSYELIPSLGLNGIGWGWLIGQAFFSIISMALITQVQHRLQSERIL